MKAITFKLKDGTEVTYDKPFIIEDEYFIKTRVTRDGETEGPWAWIHPDDKEKYDGDSSEGETILVVSANHCLAGIPWGAIYPVVTKGDSRPECNMDELMDLESEIVFEETCKEQIDAQEN